MQYAHIHAGLNSSVISGPSAIGGSGGFPMTNSSCQHICCQCGLPGRYKDCKCVEKWGPGPEGPGTVCDQFVFFSIFTAHIKSAADGSSPCIHRCCKKMKCIEHCGMLNSQNLSAQLHSNNNVCGTDNTI